MEFASAQSSWDKPYDGAKHKYTFSGITPGMEYEFFFSTTADVGSLNKVTNPGTLSITHGVVSAGEDTASVDVTWASDASSNYGTSGIYLFVRVYKTSDPAVCENYMAVKVTPQPNDFNVLVDDVTGLSDYINGDASTVADPSCPDQTGLQPVVNVSGTPYFAGTSQVVFRLHRDKSSNAWTAKFNISNSSTGTFSYTAIGNTSNTTYASGTDVSSVTNQTINVTANDEYVLVTLTVNNVPGDTPLFNLNITSASDDVTGVTVLSPQNADHGFNEMPDIQNFQGN